MAILQWNDNNLLEAVDKNNTSLFLWTYSVFEKYNRECITPSMYEFMASFVEKNITSSDLKAIEHGLYMTHPHFYGALEEDAVDAYYEVPIVERIIMHQQMLENLQTDLNRTKEKLDVLEGECPFDPKSPIYVEYMQWRNKQKEIWQAEMYDIEQEIYEEEQWRGGHEIGESDVDHPLYDHMDEF